MPVSNSVQRNFFTSTIFVGRFAGSFENFQNKIFNIKMLSFNFYPVGDARFSGSAIFPGVNSGVNRYPFGGEGCDLRPFLFREGRFYLVGLDAQALDVA